MAMLHEALRLVRLFHDMSQTELARRLQVSKSYLSEVESGKKQPTIILLEQYAKEFKLPLSSILFFSEALDNNSFSERTRLKVSQKVIALLNFIAERSGKPSSEENNGTPS
jgi:transcriptional regulator with XRE-family HTH domain